MTEVLSVQSPQPEEVTAATKTLTQVSGVIGNTPLLGVEFSYAGRRRTIYAKCEQLNLTGSIKDRMALHILRRAYADREASSWRHDHGSDEREYGDIFCGPWTRAWPSRQHLHARLDESGTQRPDSKLRGYGGSSQQGTGPAFSGSIRMAEEMAASREDVFLPCQFSNEANTEAHATTTGPEIWAQLERVGFSPLLSLPESAPEVR